MENSFQILITKRNVRIVIFGLLLLISIGALVYLYKESRHPLRQSLAANVATDALFAIITIYAIGSIENMRRKRENIRANRQVYSDAKIDLSKIMLKLLIDLGYADKKAAIRTNAMYLSDRGIYRTLSDLYENKDGIQSFAGNLKQTPRDIKKMVAIIKTIRDGESRLAYTASQVKPASDYADIYKRSNFYRIEDLKDYKNYLTDGKKYDLLSITGEDGYIKGFETRVRTVKWDYILGDFYTELNDGIKDILDAYDLCDQEAL